MISIILLLAGCDNITINCPRGTHCKVDETVHQAYCEGSCNLNNGGCSDNEVCSLLQPVTCEDAPCPSVVQCTGELHTNTFCIFVTGFEKSHHKCTIIKN